MQDKTKGWAYFAEIDIMMVETVLSNPMLTGQVAFHGQQAIEKYFKAYLTEHNVAFPKIHDLLRLYSSVKEIKDWNIDEAMLEKVSDIYTESRYPSNIGLIKGLLPSVEVAREIYEFMKKIENIFKKEMLKTIKKTDGAGPLFEDEDIDFDCEEAWGWNHANPGYFRE